MPHRLRVPVIPMAPVRISMPAALWRGFRQRCPRCGVGSSMEGYLKIRSACDHCGEALGHIRADDGPAYFTLLIAGHVVVPAALTVEQIWRPPIYPMMALATLAMVALIWRLLPRVKGAVLAAMWRLDLTGDEVQADPDAPPEPPPKSGTDCPGP